MTPADMWSMLCFFAGVVSAAAFVMAATRG
jgi:hypothetical protein